MARKLSKPSLKKQSFFKVLLGDFYQHLRLPPVFIEKLDGQSLPKCALRGPNGKLWTVELEERENGFFFHDGWQGFVRDHCLEIGNFLVFDYDGDSMFDVTIYEPTGCEKDVEAAKRRNGNPVSSVKDEIVDIETENYNKESKSKTINAERTSCKYVMSGKRPANDCVEETSTGSILFKSENSCFIKILTKILYPVTIPKELAIAEGLVRKKTVKLHDPAGRSWIVKLRVHRSPYLRFDMTKGWAKCCRANQISQGDTIVFEFVKPSVMQIHIYRGGRVGGSGCSVVLVNPGLKT
ncbi:PREDICTED: B3 [Prunus dulcis]|uniref:PREDICTED: B3 n=1 Tax=Prunus dulcis TaxID=3755 RepID=A0A5E4ELX9_PRUDU|nr:putative B3 domain-containing protein At5g66980 [Prunus dulcis]VVA16693.1 PREDICTED: B3 [Prunus dulcis]